MLTSISVSIIVPTYNRSVYLAQAIESILKQGHQDFEIIVVDDGSNDNTSQVVKNFSDERIRYVFQENNGESAARNCGLHLAQGKYIGLLDDDDFYLPNKLETQVQFLDANPNVDLIAGNAWIADENSNLLYPWRIENSQPNLTLESCIYACPLLTCAVLFRRSTLLKMTEWFDLGLLRAADTDFWLRMLVLGSCFAWKPECICAYRIHSSSSQHNVVLYSQCRIKLLDKLYAMRENLPNELQNRQAQIYAHYYLVGAFTEYKGKHFLEAKADLMMGINKDPDLLQGWPLPLFKYLVNPIITETTPNAKTYIDLVFQQLPNSLNHLQYRRLEVYSLFFLQRVFTAQTNNSLPSLLDWIYGVIYDPRWLLNRGIWSILIKRILLPFIRFLPAE